MDKDTRMMFDTLTKVYSITFIIVAIIALLIKT